MPAWLDDWMMSGVDALYERLPAAQPTREQLMSVQVISHRGERDNAAVFENTYAAFDPLRGSGVHGLEFDVRWTRDLAPVVFHDEDFLRLHGDPTRIADLSLADLRARRPEIPLLEEFVRRYAHEFHLMCELKFESYPDPARQGARLAEALAPALTRGRCTVLSLVSEMFGWLPAIPASATMLVVRVDSAYASRDALKHKRHGFSTHYARLAVGQIRRHHDVGQKLGCGFPASPKMFQREVARGVDYVFTNVALKAEGWRRQLLAQVADKKK
ncbi:MAG TPA: glycerophosphodiester phosphodiesterase [Verrucomicrobiae bacterium]|nr:glycerophosphodiester phosphodiesterase [Verrucomicrobiae bacterium]